MRVLLRAEGHSVNQRGSETLDQRPIVYSMPIHAARRIRRVEAYGAGQEAGVSLLYIMLTSGGGSLLLADMGNGSMGHYTNLQSVALLLTTQ
jgi:hypothetical protein